MKLSISRNSLQILCSFIIILSLSSWANSLQTSEQHENHEIVSQKPLRQIKNPPNNDTKICDGNRFEFLSTYVLSRQNDLTQTFAIIQKTLSVKNISYSDRVGRKYTIFNFKPTLVYLETKQVAQIKSLNVLNISGATLRLSYKFDWNKEQIGPPIPPGNGTGVVSSDPISFEKTLETNQTHELEWVLRKANPITITNSLTLKTISPYREADAEIINQMLNELKNNLTTVKMELIKALNANFTTILGDIVKNDEVVPVPKQIEYNYNDYRGPFSVLFANVLIENSLTKNGLSLIISQSIMEDKTFECGGKVPEQPQSVAKYGGTQEFISNTFFKSTLKYALLNHSLDVTLSQDNWQSRAFQFYVGDLHEVIGSTKNVSSYVELTGKCQAINEKTYFNLQMKTSTSYAVKVNFTCFLEQNGTKLVDIVLPVEYQIQPTLTTRQLNFVIKSLKGTPTFVQSSKFKITNAELASFMLMQTLKMAQKSKVIGSGYRAKGRKNPQLQVRKEYLFLYDKSTISQEPEL